MFNYIQGIAGTGKSFRLKQMAEGRLDTVLCATTGIAAVNLGAGTTINSLLWYFNSDSLKDNWTSGKLDVCLGKLYGGGVREILLDEVSMLPADDLEIIVMAITDLNNKLVREQRKILALTLAGDFCQLPPVKGRYAFEAECWTKFDESTIILREIHRQSEEAFIEALQWVREGQGKKAAEYFKPKMTPLVDLDFEGITLYPYNRQVERHNQYRLSKMQTRVMEFPSVRDGKERPEWKQHIPDVLRLKEDALVMVLANKREGGEMLYANGDLGRVKEISKDGGAVVQLQRRELPVTIETHSLENIQKNEDGKNQKVGSIKYMPLRLAYASTVHKSQGLTFDSVQVDFRNKFFKENPGMLYVAMSRCRTFDKLRLIGAAPTFARNCTMNEKVKQFL
jgi:hypothetical protein